MTFPNNIQDCIEILCNQGCGSVRKVISAMEVGQQPPETESLNNDERLVVLNELRSIIAIYDKPKK